MPPALAGRRDVTLVLVRHGRTPWVEQGRFQGRLDPPLSEHGTAQARAVGIRLADPAAMPPLPLPPGRPRLIRHSPLARAAMTAHAIRDAAAPVDARIPLVADPDLQELGHGAWEGLSHTEVEARWPDELHAWRRDPIAHHAPGGEPLAEARHRAARAVDRMLADLGGRLILTETDADAARHTLAGGAGTPAPDGLPTPSGGAVPGHLDPVVGGPGDAPDPDVEPWSVIVAHDGILRVVLLRILGLPLDQYWSFPFGLCCVSVVEVRGGRARLRAHNLDGHLAAIEDRPGHDPRSPVTGTT
jgi:probable phosphoglycerate mutase